MSLSNNINNIKRADFRDVFVFIFNQKIIMFSVFGDITND